MPKHCRDYKPTDIYSGIHSKRPSSIMFILYVYMSTVNGRSDEMNIWSCLCRVNVIAVAVAGNSRLALCWFCCHDLAVAYVYFWLCSVFTPLLQICKRLFHIGWAVKFHEFYAQLLWDDGMVWMAGESKTWYSSKQDMIHCFWPITLWLWPRFFLSSLDQPIVQTLFISPYYLSVKNTLEYQRACSIAHGSSFVIYLVDYVTNMLQLFTTYMKW